MHTINKTINLCFLQSNLSNKLKHASLKNNIQNIYSKTGKTLQAYRNEHQINKFNTTIDDFLNQELWLVSTQKLIPIKSLVKNEKIVFVFARSMGCVFCQELARQLNRDILPYLKNSNLYMVTIGKPERGLEFADLTGFPANLLLADPKNSLYDVVEFKNGIQETFFDVRTPMSIFSRALKRDHGFDLLEATLKWKPWLPPKSNQAFQQGGVLFLNGFNCKYIYVDESTGNHVDLNDILNFVNDD